jgi:para-nitrobenzyl esterase
MVRVETRHGAVEGVQVGSVCAWRGIPFARAPVGERRFGPPQPPEPWAGVRDATRFGPVGWQVPGVSLLGPLSEPRDHQSEDCLNLNVWSPAADDARRPVLVWIHGGAFVWGSGQSPWYDGASFAASGDVVVVTIHDRLGPFGFLHLSGPAGAE